MKNKRRDDFLTLPYTLHPLGDAAIMIELGEIVSEAVNNKVLQITDALKRQPFPGMIEVVPAYTTVTIHYEPRVPYDSVCTVIDAALQKENETVRKSGKLVRIPVHYGGQYGLDISEVADINGLSVQEVIAIHTSQMYDVYFLGFSPGFPFLGGLDKRIWTKRKSSPRKSIRKGSVGIAGKQTGIYSIESPGGWQMIGWTPVDLIQIEKEPPTLLQPGDKVQFVAIEQ